MTDFAPLCRTCAVPMQMAGRTREASPRNITLAEHWQCRCGAAETLPVVVEAVRCYLCGYAPTHPVRLQTTLHMDGQIVGAMTKPICWHCARDVLKEQQLEPSTTGAGG